MARMTGPGLARGATGGVSGMLALLAAESPLLRTDVIVATVLLVLVLLFGAFALLFAERWKKKALLSDNAKAADELTSFRDMFERGELTEEEYDKVRLRAADRMKRDLGLAPSSPKPNAQADGPAPPPPTG
jgi:uncharacterized membrane protein